MRSSRKDKMKEAFERLKVNHPLRLSKDGLGLTPPDRDFVTAEEPQFELTSSNVAKNENAQAEPPENQSTHNESTQNEVAYFGPNENGSLIVQALNQEVPQLKAPQSEQTRSEQPQDLSVPNELPQNELGIFSTLRTTPTAFFKMSPRIFSEAATRKMSGDCFRLFLWMSWRAWRYPDSPGVIRASVSFIEAETGMGHATASRALKYLKDEGLVSLIEINFKRGNVWKVSNLACPGRSPDPLGNRPPQNEAPQNQRNPASQGGNTSPKMSIEVPRNEQHIKKYENLRNLTNELLESFIEIISRNGAPKKKAAETCCLDQLLNSFKPEDLLRAARYLEVKGTLRGEKCHSPFTYLSFAADEVIKRIEASSVTEPTKLFVVPDETSEEDRIAALFRFENELTLEMQHSVITAYAEKEHPNGFIPPMKVLKILVALNWTTENPPAAPIEPRKVGTA